MNAGYNVCTRSRYYFCLWQIIMSTTEKTVKTVGLVWPVSNLLSWMPEGFVTYTASHQGTI